MNQVAWAIFAFQSIWTRRCQLLLKLETQNLTWRILFTMRLLNLFRMLRATPTAYTNQ